MNAGKTINILIDHGSSINMGDMAMLCNVVDYLTKHPYLKCHIVGKADNYGGVEDKLSSYPFVKLPNLSDMPHWRIRCYQRQPIYYRWICTPLFWSIMICRAVRLTVKVLGKQTPHTKAIPDTSFEKWAKTMQDMDAYWVAGGGNLNDIWVEQAF